METSWELLDMRARMRLIDTQLVILLARRFEIMRDIRAYKQARQLPLIDRQREKEVLSQALDLGLSMGVPDSIIRSLYRQMFEHVRGVDPGKGLMEIKAESAAGMETFDQAPGNR
ncbi:MAG: chorismate mutase [Gammaproteobacteria bacterium]|nr:chorismate mutase [Gammaproteobacteria bacterium]